MTKSTITRECLEVLANAQYCKSNPGVWLLGLKEVNELARMALAALDSEPEALQPELAKVIYHFRDWNEGFPVERFKADYVISWMLANYPPAQPAPERDQVRSAHAEWSQATFGNVGPIGPLKHLSKEALEAAEQPGDLSEWADMQFLLWDAQRRAGITDDQITQAMIDKLAVNKQREWPEPKDGEPRQHIKAQPAPVVPEDVRQALSQMDDEIIAELDAEESACRATMLHPGNSPAQSDCCPAQNCIHSAQGVDRPVAWHHSAKSKEGNHGTCCFSYASSHDFGPRYEKPQSQPHYLPERLDYDRALHFLSTEPRKVTPETVIGGNYPVIPDGYVMVPKEPTVNQWTAGMQAFDSGVDKVTRVYKAMLAAATREAKP